VKRLLLGSLTALGLLSTCASLQAATKDLGASFDRGVADTKKGLDPFEQSVAGRKCKAIQDAGLAWEEEHAVGGAIAVGVASKNGGLSLAPLGSEARPGAQADDQRTLYLAEVGTTLAAFSPRPTISWTFAVLDSDQVNAYSAPGGYVMVTRGLLALVENEAQLAGVLAHELAHVSLQHALHQYKVTKSWQCLMTATKDASVGNLGLNFSGTKLEFLDVNKLTADAQAKLFNPLVDAIVSKGFAQADEFEADALATDLLVSAGYDVREYEKLLGKLPSTGKVWPNHPEPAARVQKVEEERQAWAAFGATAVVPPLDPRAKFSPR
jgi:hypothetical protein